MRYEQKKHRGSCQIVPTGPAAALFLALLSSLVACSEAASEDDGADLASATEELITTESIKTSTSTTSASVAYCLDQRVYFAGTCRTLAWFQSNLSPAALTISGPTDSAQALEEPYVIVHEDQPYGWRQTTLTSKAVPFNYPKRSGYGTVGRTDAFLTHTLEGYPQTRLEHAVPKLRMKGWLAYYAWEVVWAEVTTYYRDRTEHVYLDGSSATEWFQSGDCGIHGERAGEIATEQCQMFRGAVSLVFSAAGPAGIGAAALYVIGTSVVDPCSGWGHEAESAVIATCQQCVDSVSTVAGPDGCIYECMVFCTYVPPSSTSFDEDGSCACGEPICTQLSCPEETQPTS